MYNDTYLRQLTPGDLLFPQLENIHSHQQQSQYSLLSIRQFEYDSSSKGCDCRQPSGVWRHKRLFVRVYAQKHHGDMEVCVLQRHSIVFEFLLGKEGVWGCHKHLIRELSIREAALRWQTSAPARTDGEEYTVCAHQLIQGSSSTPQLRGVTSPGTSCVVKWKRIIVFMRLSHQKGHFPVTNYSMCRFSVNIFPEGLRVLPETMHRAHKRDTISVKENSVSCSRDTSLV